MSKDSRRISEILKTKEKFIILPHVYIDGDDLGSMLALGRAIGKIGKSVLRFIPEPIPEIFTFLPDIEYISHKAPPGSYDAAILLECTDLQRLPAGVDIKKIAKTIINIDHHPDNKFYADFNWVDPGASAVAEMVYFLIKDMDVELDYEIAINLYTAILTDTGGFQYSNVTSRTHEVISQLLSIPIKTDEVYRKVYHEKSPNVLRLQGKVMANLELSDEGKIAWSYITKDMLEQYAVDEGDTQNFVEEINQIRGAQAVLFFKEIDAKKIKVSLRSSGVPVNKIAAFFGGGGHLRAAGCTVEAPLEEAVKQVVSKTREYLNQ
ncbi:MAG: bifunctional oligoribonuclease/PAP phosphatase NrnA [Firmicutes bacterium]|nr:bifunctional oligoribonuclease/PAP phosphatase NrnA [Bacillota bacterium]